MKTKSDSCAVKVGDTLVYDLVGESKIRVMAIAEGYAMVRRSRCLPFVLPLAAVAKAKLSSSQEPQS